MSQVRVVSPPAPPLPLSLCSSPMRVVERPPAASLRPSPARGGGQGRQGREEEGEDADGHPAPPPSSFPSSPSPSPLSSSLSASSHPHPVAVRYAALRSVCNRLEAEVEDGQREREAIEVERERLEEEGAHDRRLLQLLSAELLDCRSEVERLQLREERGTAEREALRETARRLRVELSAREEEKRALQAEAAAASAAVVDAKRRLLAVQGRSLAEERAMQQRMAAVSSTIDEWSRELQSREVEREQLLEQLQRCKDVAQHQQQLIDSLRTDGRGQGGGGVGGATSPPPAPLVPSASSPASILSTPIPAPSLPSTSLLSPASLVLRIRESPFATPVDLLPSPSAPPNKAAASQSAVLPAPLFLSPLPHSPPSAEGTFALPAPSFPTSAGSNALDGEKVAGEEAKERGVEGEEAVAVAAPTARELRDDVQFPPLISPTASSAVSGAQAQSGSRRQRLAEERKTKQRKGRRRGNKSTASTAAVEASKEAPTASTSPSQLQPPSPRSASISPPPSRPIPHADISPEVDVSLDHSKVEGDGAEEEKAALPVVRSLAAALQGADEDDHPPTTDATQQQRQSPPAASSEAQSPSATAPLQLSDTPTTPPSTGPHLSPPSLPPPQPSGALCPSCSHPSSPPPPVSLPLPLSSEPITPAPRGPRSAAETSDDGHPHLGSSDGVAGETMSGSPSRDSAHSCAGCGRSLASEVSAALPSALSSSSSLDPSSSAASVLPFALTPRSSSQRSLAVLDSEFRRVRRWTEQMREEMRRQPTPSTPTAGRARSHSDTADTPAALLSVGALQRRPRSLSSSSPSAVVALESPATSTAVLPSPRCYWPSVVSSSPLSTSALLLSLSVTREELALRCVALQSAYEHSRSVEDKMRSLMESYEALELRMEHMEERHREELEDTQRRAQAELTDAQRAWVEERTEVRRSMEELQAELERSQQAMIDAAIRLHEGQAETRTLQQQLHQQAEEAQERVEEAAREVATALHRWQQRRLERLQVQGQEAISIVDSSAATDPLQAQPPAQLDGGASLGSLAESLALSCDSLEKRLRQLSSLTAQPSADPPCSTPREGETQLWSEMMELQSFVHEWRIP